MSTVYFVAIYTDFVTLKISFRHSCTIYDNNRNSTNLSVEIDEEQEF